MTDNAQWSVPQDAKLWAVFRHGDIDVVPTNDDKEHIAGAKCECHPVVEIHGSYLFVLHNAYDFREVLEGDLIKEILNG